MTANRLALEKSPYLLQHAHNPVDWFAWGPEAFSKARSEEKPIFLSSGYSTCHWCHVMERESFENPAIAELLNRHFVSIKLDREERPDVDRVYMTFVQATTGSGGWPLSVFLTPDLKPFYGGTYFPPEDRHARPGFARLLSHLAEAWQSRRAELTKTSIDITAQLESYLSVEPAPDRAAESSIEACFHSLRRSFDHQNAGFGAAPKFPRPSTLNFLLRYFARSGDELARDMALSTLRAMARGGMCDQLGGGFHRYSVDARWHVPHFEKMLYDQAQLAVSLLEAFQLSNDPEFAQAARATLDYVLRDMTHPGGAFYSAEDADSAPDPAHPHAKSEGAFYLWSQSEIESLLDPSSAAGFCRAYGVRPNGNVAEDPHAEFTGKNILFQFLRPGPALDPARSTLLQARALRPRPHLDDKILTSSNALMISAFVKGAQVLAEPRYAQAALRAFAFIEENLVHPSTGALFRRWRDNQAAIDAFLDDYAALALAALDLHSLTFEPRYLDRAQALAHRMIDLFEDPINGAFFSAPVSHSELILRVKEDYDGAEPSGNSLAAALLVRLHRLTANPLYRESAARTFIAFASRINQQSPTIPQMMCSFMLSIEPLSELQLSGDAQPLADEFNRRFLPFTTLAWAKSQDPPKAVLCHDFVCRPAVSTVDQLRELLN